MASLVKNPLPSRVLRAFFQEELRSVRTQPPPGAKYAWPGPETIGAVPFWWGKTQLLQLFGLLGSKGNLQKSVASCWVPFNSLTKSGAPQKDKPMFEP